MLHRHSCSLVLAIVVLCLVPATNADAAGFTGKRVYRVVAKSWIDGDAITEAAWVARKIRLNVNVRPLGPELSDRFDYKLYQSLGAEVEFRNGKVIRAEFIPEWTSEKANTTFGLYGEVRRTEQVRVVARDGSEATFVRKIEGNPNQIIKAADLAFAEAVADAWRLNLPASDIRIYNVVELIVKGDTAELICAGSAFPTHDCWLQEDGGAPHPAKPQLQVQPSEFFKTVPTLIFPRPAQVKKPVLLPGPAVARPAGPRILKAKPDVAFYLAEVAKRACAAPGDIDQWIGEYAWLPTGDHVAAVTDEMPPCEKTLFLDLVHWNAERDPAALDGTWLRLRMSANALPAVAIQPVGPCGRMCTNDAPARQRDTRDWCIRDCGCRGYDASTQRCVP